MASIPNVLTDSWGPYSHTEVEAALKAILTRLVGYDITGMALSLVTENDTKKLRVTANRGAGNDPFVGEIEFSSLLGDVISELRGKAGLDETGHLDVSQWPMCGLYNVTSLTSSEIEDIPANKLWYDSSTGKLIYRNSNSEDVEVGAPGYVLYYCGDKIYRRKSSGAGFELLFDPSAAGGGELPVNENTGRLDYDTLPSTVLLSMGATLDGTSVSLSGKNGYYFNPVDSLIYYLPEGSNSPVEVSAPDKGLVYCNDVTGKLYKWDPTLNSNAGGFVEVGQGPQYDLSSKANLVGGILAPEEWPQVILANVGTIGEEDPVGEGAVVFITSNSHLYLLTGIADVGDSDDWDGYTYEDLGEPQPNTVYFHATTGKTYQWDSSDQEFVQFGDNVAMADVLALIENTLASNASNKMLSAAMGKKLYQRTVTFIDVMQAGEPNATQVVTNGYTVWFRHGQNVTDKIILLHKEDDTVVILNELQFDPEENAVYYIASEKKFYKYQNGTLTAVFGETDNVPTEGSSNLITSGAVFDALDDLEIADPVVAGVDHVDVVDSHSSNDNTVLAAPSLRQMIMAAANIDTLFAKLNDLYDKLAGIAFTDGKPASSWKETANWSTPNIPQHTLTVGTLTDCSIEIGGDAVSGSELVNEGGLEVTIIPNSSTDAITEVLVNGESVEFTSTGNADGSVVAVITVSGNFTIDATASTGVDVDFSSDSSEVSFSNSGSTLHAVVPNGQNLNITIYASEHFTLPEHLTYVKVGSTLLTETTDYTYTRASDNKSATLYIAAAKITDDIEIKAVAIENGHVTLDLTLGTNVLVKAGGDQKNDGDKLYNSEGAITVSIEPAPGYKLSAGPTVSIGGDQTFTSGNVYDGYTFSVGTGASGTVTISASGNAIALESFEIALPSGQNFTAEIQDANGTPIQPVENQYMVQEGKTIKIEFSPDTGYSVAISSVTMTPTGGSAQTLDTSSLNSSYYTFADNVLTIVNVQGDIVVSATASKVVQQYAVPDGTLDTDSETGDPVVGKLIAWWDGEDGFTEVNNENVWQDKVNHINAKVVGEVTHSNNHFVLGSGNYFVIDDASGGHDSEEPLQGSQLSLDCDDYTIEVVIGPNSGNTQSQPVFSTGPRHQLSSGYDKDIGLIVYHISGLNYISGMYIRNGETRKNSSDVDVTSDGGHVWADPLNSSINRCISVNSLYALANGQSCRTLGQNKYVTTQDSRNIGYINAYNQYARAPFYGNIYAIRIYRGHLTEAQMLYNQQIDNDKYGLSLTLPDSLT